MENVNTDLPLCPITNTPAIRKIESISAEFLEELWRITFKTNAKPSFHGVKEIGLYESVSLLLITRKPML